MNFIDRINFIFDLIFTIFNYLIDDVFIKMKDKIMNMKNNAVTNQFTESIFNVVILPLTLILMLIYYIIVCLLGYPAILLLLLLWILLTIISSIFSLFLIKNTIVFKPYVSLEKPFKTLNPIKRFHYLVFSRILSKIFIKYLSYKESSHEYNVTQKVSYSISLFIFLPFHILISLPILVIYAIGQILGIILLGPVWLVNLLVFIVLG